MSVPVKLPPYTREAMAFAEGQPIHPWAVEPLRRLGPDRGKGIKIAVLDTGPPDSWAAEMGGRFKDVADFTGEGTTDHQGHGTATASVACGSEIDGSGPGVACAAETAR